jgi:hypothetical protein
MNKILDPTRKGLLKLHGNALKIWMAHWMHENIHDKSWPSIPSLMAETELSHNTVEKWRSWLVRNGWLEKTGKHPIPDNNGYTPEVTAKDGSKVDVMEADWGVADMPQTCGKDTANLQDSKPLDAPAPPPPPQKLGSSQVLPPQKLGDKGFVLGSVVFGSIPALGIHGSSAKSGAPLGKMDGEQTTTKTAEPTAPLVTGNGRVKASPDGTPYPEGFNSWRNEARIEWLMAHGLGQKPRVTMSGGQGESKSMWGADGRLVRPVVVEAPSDLDEPPDSAAPPKAGCVTCQEEFASFYSRCDSCWSELSGWEKQEVVRAGSIE